MNVNPLTQINLFEHKEIFNQLYKLSKNDTLPNKILLSGEKGIGKSTLAYHLINFVLSENEEHPYDYENNKINPDNKSYKLILNKSNPNFYLIDVQEDKKNIDIPLVALSEVEEAGLLGWVWDFLNLFFLKLLGGDPLEP